MPSNKQSIPSAAQEKAIQHINDLYGVDSWKSDPEEPTNLIVTDDDGDVWVVREDGFELPPW